MAIVKVTKFGVPSNPKSNPDENTKIQGISILEKLTIISFYQTHSNQTEWFQ
jgi:hypothetical protein